MVTIVLASPEHQRLKGLTTPQKPSTGREMPWVGYILSVLGDRVTRWSLGLHRTLSAALDILLCSERRPGFKCWPFNAV